ncbi:MAG: HIT domain-containing protein [Mycoplasmataceae bacterium]|jgi:histidine triad (HIT) family protein|nr:HIT domain-containing protein [Mycoplasmataceae bacterium]
MECIFCKLIKEQKMTIIAQNDLALAFLDINPVSDGHTLVVSKKHIENLSTCDQNTLNAMMELVLLVTNKIKKSSLKPNGFNYLSNENKIAGQLVPHFHIHIMPKYDADHGYTHLAINRQVRPIDEIAKLLA